MTVFDQVKKEGNTSEYAQCKGDRIQKIKTPLMLQRHYRTDARQSIIMEWEYINTSINRHFMYN
jgi:hypothetical protein